MIALQRFLHFSLLFSLSFSLGTSRLSGAQTITTFQDAFQLTTPATNWAYLWNASGPIGNPANYEALIPNSSGSYTMDGSNVYPSPPPGNYLSFGLPDGLPGGHPGMGASQDGSGNIERYVIAAYTISEANRIGIHDGFIRNINPNFGGSADGLNLKIFVNDIGTPLLSRLTDAGFNMSTTFSVALGNLIAGDKIYVAIGSNNSDLFDGFELGYSIVTVPEPNSAGLAILAVLGLACQVPNGRNRKSRFQI